jgi:hypothetical protein
MQNACSCSKISSVEGLKEEFEKHGKMVSCLGHCIFFVTISIY